MTSARAVAVSSFEQPVAQAAVSYARQVHRGQRRRSDGEPFVAHLLEVATLLREAGASEPLVTAGVLHDTLEKTKGRPASCARDSASTSHGSWWP